MKPKVVVIAEYYPSETDPVLGIWAHRQAVAARNAGADVRVIVLFRPIPPLSDVKRLALRNALERVHHPRKSTLDGIDISYVRFFAPHRPSSYPSWGRWASKPLRRALKRLEREFPFDLVHAHYASPAAAAFIETGIEKPLVTSVHGGDVLGLVEQWKDGEQVVSNALSYTNLTLANSKWTANLCERFGAKKTKVVHLGTDIPARRNIKKRKRMTLVTVGHLVERKRHADVLRALWILRDRHPDLRYVIVGDGPERSRLEQLATELGVADRVKFRGQMEPEQTLKECRRAHLFVLPSVDEAFGVAYIEAMAGGLPAIGCIGEGGPEEIASCGEGIRLVPPGDVERLAEQINELLSSPDELVKVGKLARQTVKREFTWELCGKRTVKAYNRVLDDNSSL